MSTVLPRTLTSTRQGKAPCPRPKSAVVKSRCLPPRKPAAHCQPCRNTLSALRWRTLLACAVAPLSHPRSLTSTALLMRLRGLSAAAAECRPVCNVIRSLNAVRTKKIVSEARRQPSTLHVPTLDSIGILYQGLLPWLRCASCPTLSTLCLSHPLSMLLSEQEFAVSQCVGTCQQQHSQPICHGVLCMVQGVLPSICICVVSPSSPKVSTQSLNSHCVDHIPPSATRIFRTTLCTRCVSLGVPPPRNSQAVEKTRKCSWRSLRIIVAVSSSSLLARCLDCCSLLDGHKNGSPITATAVLSASSAWQRSQLTRRLALLFATFHTAWWCRHRSSCASGSCSRRFMVAGRDVHSKFLSTDVTAPVEV